MMKRATRGSKRSVVWRGAPGAVMTQKARPARHSESRSARFEVAHPLPGILTVRRRPRASGGRMIRFSSGSIIVHATLRAAPRRGGALTILRDGNRDRRRRCLSWRPALMPLSLPPLSLAGGDAISVQLLLRHDASDGKSDSGNEENRKSTSCDCENLLPPASLLISTRGRRSTQSPTRQRNHHHLGHRLLLTSSLLFGYVLLTGVRQFASSQRATGRPPRGELLPRQQEANQTALINAALSSPSWTEPDTGKLDTSGPCDGKEPLLAILASAGYDIEGNATRVELCEQLPLWSEVAELYGEEPRILGLETCHRYRDMLQRDRAEAAAAPRSRDPDIFPMPRVAGLPNSGTTALADTLWHNFDGRQDPTIHDKENPRAYNVPWRKHTPLRYRWNVTSDSYGWREDKRLVLPVVLVRDPYRWMGSMCKLSYNVRWIKSTRHCPNLVAYPDPSSGSPAPEPEAVPVEFVLWEPPELNVRVRYLSMAHFWSQFNRAYLDTDMPRLIVRYEDTLFHSRAVFEAINECVGHTIPRRFAAFQPYADKAKAGRSNDLLGALAKNGAAADRYSRMVAEDLAFARAHLDPGLLARLHYPHPANNTPPESYAAIDWRRRQRKQRDKPEAL